MLNMVNGVDRGCLNPTTTKSSLRVAVPIPKEKRGAGNVYEKLAQIGLCDVTLLHENL